MNRTILTIDGVFGTMRDTLARNQCPNRDVLGQSIQAPFVDAMGMGNFNDLKG